MKKIVTCTLFVALVMFFSGCATAVPVGSLFTDLQLPVGVTSNGTASPKVGTAECMSFFSLVAIGDASIETAKKNGGITKVDHVDWKVNNILGIIGKYKVVINLPNLIISKI